MRELLFNVVKHAGVQQAQILVLVVDDLVTIKLRDQGRGFDAISAPDKPHPSGYGLRSIQQRLLLFQGQLIMHSQPGSGTEVTIQLPYQSQLSHDRG